MSEDLKKSKNSMFTDERLKIFMVFAVVVFGGIFFSKYNKDGFEHGREEREERDRKDKKPVTPVTPVISANMMPICMAKLINEILQTYDFPILNNRLILDLPRIIYKEGNISPLPDGRTILINQDGYYLVNFNFNIDGIINGITPFINCSVFNDKFGDMNYISCNFKPMTATPVSSSNIFFLTKDSKISLNLTFQGEPGPESYITISNSNLEVCLLGIKNI